MLLNHCIDYLIKINLLQFVVQNIPVQVFCKNLLLVQDVERLLMIDHLDSLCKLILIH